MLNETANLTKILTGDDVKSKARNRQKAKHLSRCHQSMKRD